ncbi:hypothetical protein SBA4_3630002 [Candidatus Sulfopaludibacter sp. SbA4]|nr:hypothetical protein SBA4_3630002 [Candidatus Sulfopaludibacter sp. SbA4]
MHSPFICARFHQWLRHGRVWDSPPEAVDKGLMATGSCWFLLPVGEWLLPLRRFRSPMFSSLC